MKRIIPLSPRRWLALEIFRRMKRERIEEHPLRQLFWECTLRCNVRCRHCGSDCKSSPSTPDMPLEDFLKVRCIPFPTDNLVGIFLWHKFQDLHVRSVHRLR